MFIKSILATLGLAALAMAGTTPSHGKGCDTDQTVVCKGNGDGGVLTLGNVLPGALGSDCSGEVYCCDTGAVNEV